MVVMWTAVKPGSRQDLGPPFGSNTVCSQGLCQSASTYQGKVKDLKVVAVYQARQAVTGITQRGKVLKSNQSTRS